MRLPSLLLPAPPGAVALPCGSPPATEYPSPTTNWGSPDVKPFGEGSAGQPKGLGGPAPKAAARGRAEGPPAAAAERFHRAGREEQEEQQPEGGGGERREGGESDSSQLPSA